MSGKMKSKRLLRNIHLFSLLVAFWGGAIFMGFLSGFFDWSQNWVYMNLMSYVCCLVLCFVMYLQYRKSQLNDQERESK